MGYSGVSSERHRQENTEPHKTGRALSLQRESVALHSESAMSMGSEATLSSFNHSHGAR